MEIKEFSGLQREEGVDRCGDFELKVEIGNGVLAEDIANFQIAMAMESEGASLDCERVMQGVKAVLEDDTKGRYLVAKVNDKLVGCLMLTQEWSDWNCCWYWWIQSVYVVPKHRVRGIYKTMYGKVLELANAEGISQIRLYVDKNNFTAQRVYQKLGMSECHYCMYETEI